MQNSQSVSDAGEGQICRLGLIAVNGVVETILIKNFPELTARVASIKRGKYVVLAGRAILKPRQGFEVEATRYQYGGETEITQNVRGSDANEAAGPGHTPHFIEKTIGVLHVLQNTVADRYVDGFIGYR